MAVASAPNTSFRAVTPALGQAIPASVAALSAVGVPLLLADALRLSGAQTAAMLAALYGLPGVLSLALTAAYRQPLLVGWSTTSMIFLLSLADRFAYPQLIGATLIAGAAVLLLGALGLSARLAAAVPASVVFGVLAGAVTPFAAAPFGALAGDPALVGGMLAAFLAGRRLLGGQVPAVVPPLIVGIAVALVGGRLVGPPEGWTLPTLTTTAPAFSLPAILAASPVVATLILVQANLAAVVYLRSERYRPPARLIDIATGAGTMLGSLAGVAPISMAGLLAPLTAGPEAGEHRLRHWSVYATGSVFVLTVPLVGIAATLPEMIPSAFLLTLVGLALLGVLGQAIGEIARGPLRLAPLLAFVVASSGMTVGGLGPPFWALALGLATSQLLERDALRAMRAGETAIQYRMGKS